jgi:hypothetical protein
VTKHNSPLQALKRRLLRELITRPGDKGDCQLQGVDGVIAWFNFALERSDENAVNVIVEQFNREIEKLQEKGIPRDRWPKFLQNPAWKEKVYQKFGVVPYPGATEGSGDIQGDKE